MSRQAREILAASFFLLLFAFIGWLTLDFGPRARLIPLPLAIVGGGLALFQIVLSLSRPGGLERMKIIEVDTSALPGADASDVVPSNDASLSVQQPKRRREWVAYAVVIGFCALVMTVGPVIAMFVFTTAYFMRTRVYSPLRSLIFGSVYTGIVYLLFFTTLQIEPYYGVLAPLFAHNS